MKKNKSLIIILAIVALIALWGVSAYNSLVTRSEAVEKAWSQVENQYQRRSDLIPNLVSTVKGYAAHESQTLTEVTEARAKATQLTIDPKNLTPEALAQFQAAQGDVTSALGKLMAIREAYPDLKANQNFLELQAQLEGTENRITVARKDFNEESRAYNVAIRRFPNSLIANWFGFDAKPYFDAKAGADVAPVVEF
ncbi:MAG: LemA family protein [Tidjanibacter sp.]|nr:LemA family protein [Tidjanibacter sp.]